MPAVPLGSKILITGANGYIAAWTVKALLDQGYSVRGTVRSPAKSQLLKEYLSSYRDKLEFVVVEDITKDGAFDQAIQGVDGVLHMASPATSENGTLSDYVEPAVNGTNGILKSALKFGTAIKRIVITSSTVAIVNPFMHTKECDEDDWNDDAVNEAQEKGNAASPLTKYYASKTLAEQAAWRIYNENKTQISWDLVALNVPLVIGTPLLKVSSASELNAFFKFWYNMVVDPEPKPKEVLNLSYSWVDVRDAAEAHVKSLWKESAGSERIVFCAGRATWQEWINVVTTFTPPPALSQPLPRGIPELEVPPMVKWNTAKEARILGLDYKTMEQTARDFFDFVVSCGLY